MNRLNPYFFERLFVALVFLVSIAGFWDIYMAADAKPNLHHHAHVATNFIWLSLLAWQLSLIGGGKYSSHKRVGLSILVAGPLLVATAALLSVHSAHKGLVSGEGDFLIVQNVMTTLELGLFIVAAFVLRARRKLHGALLLSTGMLFLGIALFFSLISFVPMFRIEGPETFYRFETAAATARYVCIAIGVLFLVKDPRHGWPMLLAASFFSFNDLVKSFLTERELIQPLTELVGSMSQPMTFIGSFALLLALLVATGVHKASGGAKRQVRTKPLRGEA